LYNAVLWSYGLYHNDVDTSYQYLQTTKLPQLVGPYLNTPLVNTTDPVEMSLYTHLEYGPIINPRAHQNGIVIKNVKFNEQYKKFLQTLCYTPKFGNPELMASVYYLLLQDRITEAKAQFARINFVVKTDQEAEGNPDEAKEIEQHNVPFDLELQYDYLRAFLDFYGDKPNIARKIASKYANYPVPHWKKLFQDITVHLKEIETTEDIEQDMNTSRPDALEPYLDFDIEGKHIVINYENIKECSVRYYKMDIELLFSSSPFVQQNLGNFSYIMPNISTVVALPQDTELHKIDLPAECQNTNVMIEFSSGNLSKVKPHFSHSLFVKVLNAQGMIKVCSKTTGSPLAKSYIKVFAKLTDGTNAFYKDGYTDLRGKFDFLSLSSDASNFIDCYSILVISDKFGTTIVEAHPPNVPARPESRTKGKPDKRGKKK